MKHRMQAIVVLSCAAIGSAMAGAMLYRTISRSEPSSPFTITSLHWEGALDGKGRPLGKGKEVDDLGNVVWEGEYREGRKIGVWILYRAGKPYGKVDCSVGDGIVRPYGP